MDWELTEVAAQQCGVAVKVCKSIKNLLQDGCTIPFICRYRSAQVDNATPDTVRTVVSTLSDLEDVAAKTVAFLETDKANRLRLANLERGRTTPKSPQELAQLRDMIIPESISVLLRRCTKMEECKQLMAFFKPAPQQSKAAQCRAAGYGPLLELLLSGDGSAITREKICQISPTLGACPLEELQTGLATLLADVIAKAPSTFELVQTLPPPKLVSKLKTNKKPGKSPEVTDDDNRAKRKQTGVLPKADPATFELFFDYSAVVTRIEAHTVLALNRGEGLKILRLSLEYSADVSEQYTKSCYKNFGNINRNCFGPNSVFSRSSLTRILESGVEQSWKGLVQVE